MTYDQLSGPGFLHCGQYQGTPPASATVKVSCTTPDVRGRYVYISSPTEDLTLTICELELAGRELTITNRVFLPQCDLIFDVVHNNYNILHKIYPVECIFSLHGVYWWPGALAPGHQQPQCWVRTSAFPAVYELMGDVYVRQWTVALLVMKWLRLYGVKELNIWTNASLLSIGPMSTNFSEFLIKL